MEEEELVLLKRRMIPGGVAYVFFCPGCQQPHSYDVLWNGTGWKFNGDMERPTFTPSLQLGNCHLFITNGMVDFCGDCHHCLKGKRVPMQPF